MYSTADLGDLVIPDCDDCQVPPGHLCEHSQRVAPLAEAIARGFGATADDPRTGAFLSDAEWIFDRIGPGPYEVVELDVDAAPGGPIDEQPYCAALLINRWVVAFPFGDPGDTIPVVVGRIP